MTCRKIKTHLADLILEPGSAPADVREHVSQCAGCASEVAALKATMTMLEEWQAPEPGAFFDAKLYARLRSQEAHAPVGPFARIQSWLLYNSRFQMRQWAGGALATVLAIGGGTYVLLNQNQVAPAVVQASATVRDLQSYDGNVQLFQQLNALDSTDSGASN